MGIGFVFVVQVLFVCIGLLVVDFDVIELNEVFVLQVLVVMQEFGFDLVCVNLNGGVIVLGYFVGVIGVIIMLKVMVEL